MDQNLHHQILYFVFFLFLNLFSIFFVLIQHPQLMHYILVHPQLQLLILLIMHFLFLMRMVLFDHELANQLDYDLHQTILQVI